MGKIRDVGKGEKNQIKKQKKGKGNREALLASLRPAPGGVFCPVIDCRLSFTKESNTHAGLLTTAASLHHHPLSVPPGFSNVLRGHSNGYFMFPKNRPAASGAQLAMRTLPYQPCYYLQWNSFTHPSSGPRVQGTNAGWYNRKGGGGREFRIPISHPQVKLQG